MTSPTLPTILSSIFDHLTLSSVQAGFGILLVYAIRLTLGYRLRGSWMYLLWLIVMLRLALPWVPQTRWSPVPAQLSPRVRMEQRAAVPLPPTPVEVTRLRATALSAKTVDAETGAHVAAQTAEGGLVAAVESPSAWAVVSLLYGVWLAGIVVFAGVVAAKVLRFRRSILHVRPLTDSAVLDLLEDSKQQMGITAPVVVVVTDQIGSPALFGFLRPRLLLPTGVLEALNREELRHVLLHELAHLKRHDVLVGWVICAVQIMHWCNPLVWVAQNWMRADREVACDALVLSMLRGGGPREYGNTIVRLLERFSQPRYLPALTGISRS